MNGIAGIHFFPPNLSFWLGIISFAIIWAGIALLLFRMNKRNSFHQEITTSTYIHKIQKLDSKSSDFYFSLRSLFVGWLGTSLGEDLLSYTDEELMSVFDDPRISEVLLLFRGYCYSGQKYTSSSQSDLQEKCLEILNELIWA